MGIVKTTVFQLEAPDDAEPLGNWAGIARRNSTVMDAAMAQRVTPPGIPDLNAEVAARTALAARVATLEAGAVTELTPASGVAHVAGYAKAGVYRVGRGVFLTSLLTTTATLGNGAALFTLTTAYRPPGTGIVPLLVNAQTGSPLANSSVRVDVNATTGVVSTVNGLASGSYLFLDSAQFPGA